MDFRLTDDQLLMKDALGKLSARYGREYWLSCMKKGEGPEELWRELARSGYVGLLIPEEYGGAGLGMGDMEVLLETVSENGTPLLFLVVSAVMGTLALVKHGSEEQRKRYLPRLASGEIKFCFALTEPDAGSNSFRITTRARRDGDVYKVDGR